MTISKRPAESKTMTISWKNCAAAIHPTPATISKK